MFTMFTVVADAAVHRVEKSQKSHSLPARRRWRAKAAEATQQRVIETKWAIAPAKQTQSYIAIPNACFGWKADVSVRVRFAAQEDKADATAILSLHQSSDHRSPGSRRAVPHRHISCRCGQIPRHRS